MSKTAFLRGKTDAQCRELAGHYYRRARKAEAERDSALVECDRLRGLMIRVKRGYEALLSDCDLKHTQLLSEIDEALSTRP